MYILLFLYRRQGGTDTGSWAHDGEYSYWHTTHQDLLRLSPTPQSLFSPHVNEKDHRGSMPDADAMPDADWGAGVGDGEESEPEVVGAQGGEGAQSGCAALLRLRAKLIAHNCDVAAALAVADAMQSRLQGFGSIKPSDFKQHLTQVIETMMQSRLIPGHKATSAAQVLDAIRLCLALYPGAHLSSLSYLFARRPLLYCQKCPDTKDLKQLLMSSHLC